MQRATVFEHFIETLAIKDDHCEWVKKISFETATKYMNEACARVIQSEQPYPEESVLYEVIVNGRAYSVRTSRDVLRTGTLLASKFKEE